MKLNLAPIEDQYKKHKDLKPEDVKSLAEWAELQPHLPKMTELEIILFLHACLYRQEFAKTVIDFYYTCRTHCPEFFSNRNPNLIQKIHLDLVCYSFLPGVTPDGTKVLYVKLMDKNPSNFNFNEQLKIFGMVYDMCILREGTLDGHCILLDMEGGTLSHLARVGVMAVKKYLFYLQEAMPIRRRGIHFINVVSFMDKVMTLIKPFLKKELLEMLYLHMDGLDSLYKYIPQNMLPKDLGGNGMTCTEMHENMKKDLIQHTEYFKEEELQRIDETKRPGKAKNAGDLFGVEGTFKKLDID